MDYVTNVSSTALFNSPVAQTHLYSELPQRSNRDPRDRAVMVRRDNGALLGSTNTGHSLEREES